MDAAWNYRQAYNEARKVKEAQDQFCEDLERGRIEAAPEFPESPLELESLVDVLRGRVKVNNLHLEYRNELSRSEEQII